MPSLISGRARWSRRRSCRRAADGCLGRLEGSTAGLEPPAGVGRASGLGRAASAPASARYRLGWPRWRRPGRSRPRCRDARQRPDVARLDPQVVDASASATSAARCSWSRARPHGPGCRSCRKSKEGTRRGVQEWRPRIRPRPAPRSRPTSATFSTRCSGAREKELDPGMPPVAGRYLRRRGLIRHRDARAAAPPSRSSAGARRPGRRQCAARAPMRRSRPAACRR